MHEKLKQILLQIRPDINFETETGLITEEKLDSFDIISIIEAVMEELEVDIPVEGINEENFDSLQKMERFISKLQTSR